MISIGVIRTEYKTMEGMPIQPAGAANTTGTIIVKEEFRDGLIDLDGFSHIYLIYQFHLSVGFDLKPRPFLDDKVHGVFATRAPRRPNPIGLSIVKLLSVNDNVVEVAGADLIDGTPLFDIKPYIEQFDKVGDSSNGWLKVTGEQIRTARADHRFKK